MGMQMSLHPSFISLLARILICVIFIVAGVEKITAYEASAAYMQGHGLAPALLPVAIIIELGGGLAILAGFYARWAALLLALFCLVTGFFFHADFTDPAQSIAFMKNLAIAGGLLLLFVNGPGRYALRG